MAADLHDASEESVRYPFDSLRRYAPTAFHLEVETSRFIKIKYAHLGAQSVRCRTGFPLAPKTGLDRVRSKAKSGGRLVRYRTDHRSLSGQYQRG